MSPAVEKCPGCAAELDVIDGPTHRYIGASPACWAVYGRLLAGDIPLAPNRGVSLLVDAYAAQHPGGDSPQATQSAAVHLIVLQAVAHHGLAPRDLVALRGAAVDQGRGRGGYPRLLPAPDSWQLTIHDLANEGDPDKRARLAATYPQAVLEAWSAIHGQTIAEWYRTVG